MRLTDARWLNHCTWWPGRSAPRALAPLARAPPPPCRSPSSPSLVRRESAPSGLVPSCQPSFPPRNFFRRIDAPSTLPTTRRDPLLKLFHRQLERLRVLAGRLPDHLLLVRSQLDPEGFLRASHRSSLTRVSTDARWLNHRASPLARSGPPALPPSARAPPRA